MLKNLTDRLKEIENREQEIEKEITKKVEQTDKREFNNKHINRSITFNVNEELFKRFQKEHQKELDQLIKEKKEIRIKAEKKIRNNLEEVKKQYKNINRINDIIEDVKNYTDQKENAVSYFLDQIK